MLFSKKFVSATEAHNYGTFTKPVNAPYLRKNVVLEALPEKA